MPFSAPPLANAHAATGDFFRHIFTGAFSGDLLSIVVLAIAALIILRFTAARWFFVLAKQIVIFGGLAAGVWFGSSGVSDRFGETAGQALLIVGGSLVAILFFIMLYMFFLRRGREKALIRAGKSPEEARRIAFGKGAKTLQGGPKAPLGAQAQRSGAKAAAAGAGGGGGATGAGGAGATQAADPELSKVEETLKKMNVLGATKEQNLLTVSVLILVAQFGVFTSRTVSAPSATVGMALAGAFAVGAAVFVLTAYTNRMKGLIHFVYATVFGVVISVLLLVYWLQTFPCADYHNAAQIASACAGGDDASATVTWGIALNPRFYFASEGLIAAITGVAFSTLLTKGGG